IRARRSSSCDGPRQELRFSLIAQSRQLRAHLTERKERGDEMSDSPRPERSGAREQAEGRKRTPCSRPRTFVLRPALAPLGGVQPPRASPTRRPLFCLSFSACLHLLSDLCPPVLSGARTDNWGKARGPETRRRARHKLQREAIERGAQRGRF